LNFVGATSLNSSVTFTRASTATYFNSAGVLTSAATNAPRFDYNPSTLAARGLLIEEARTNSIRNNTMVGAANPSTLPTNWGGNSIGLTRTVVGTGVQNGIAYIDVRYSGTTVGQFGGITFEPNNVIAASASQSWTGSAYISLVAGTLTNIAELGIALYYFDSSAVFLSVTAPPAAVTSTLTRYFSTGTTPASTAFIQPGIYFNTTAASGQAVDFTIRIGLPQLELGAFATSVIPTTTTALTRAADVASVNTLSPWFNSVAGTLFAEIQSASSVTGNRSIASINDGTTDNRIQMRHDGATTNINFIALSGSVNYAQSLTFASGAINKTALGYETNNVNSAANGVAGTTDTSETLPTGMTKLELGNVVGVALYNGYLRRISYWPRRLANAELQSITS
jgi:hypothetical protein